MGGIGTMLRGGREAAGLGQDELARMIRITPAAARALEEEDWDSLPDLVFVRGFVTSWARAVGMDERQARDALARAVDSEGDAERSLPRLPDSTGIVLGTRSSRSRRTGRRAGLAVFVFVVAAALAALGLLFLSRPA